MAWRLCGLDIYGHDEKVRCGLCDAQDENARLRLEITRLNAYIAEEPLTTDATVPKIPA